MKCDVLVVGAGPTGLVLALWLTKLGVRVRIIDKTAGPGTTSRAVAVQARTLELYRQLDLTDAVVARGHRTPAVNLWVKGARAARMLFENVGADLTPYPFLHMFPQDAHEQLLVERLQAFGVSVERSTELLGFEDTGDRVIASLRRLIPNRAGTTDAWETGGAATPVQEGGTQPDAAETCEAAWIAGCDGARSVVRDVIGTGFPGGTYRQLFYVADVETEGPTANGELHIDLDEADFLAVFPLADPVGDSARVRLIGTVRDERADRADTLAFEDVSDRAIRNLKVSVRQVNWFSTYHVHHRVTEHFRDGRAFLLGDAAHIHSPAGGQGMNTGIGDAINLAWKLAAVLGGRASERLLDSYEAERRPFAQRLVATTDRLFSFATAEGMVADFLRTRIAPLLIPEIASFEMAREYLFRTMGQITLNYRGSPLSFGRTGKIHGGDRLPWVAVDGGDNFAPLAAITWQVHVYGSATEELRAWCEQHGVALHVFAWRPEHLEAGLQRNGFYLLRPDSYVALADGIGSAEALDWYCNEQRINIGDASPL
jgi:2-polyprenyl-6-methoxyphenol hydroxylase-like FAD-dependent oxidoreductase